LLCRRAHWKLGTVGPSDEEDAIIDRYQISQSYRDVCLLGFVAESRVGAPQLPNVVLLGRGLDDLGAG
jgi:hypothetical protein